MTRTKPTPEGKTKTAVKKLLDQYGHFYFSPVMGTGKAGIPDIVVCLYGRFIGIEVKATPKEKPTALQKRRAQEIRAAGGEVFLVHADNFEQFAFLMNNFMRLPPKKCQQRMIPFLLPEA